LPREALLVIVMSRALGGVVGWGLLAMAGDASRLVARNGASAYWFLHVASLRSRAARVMPRKCREFRVPFERVPRREPEGAKDCCHGIA
jgi:hypothetical protein